MGKDDIALGLMCKAPLDGACKTRLCPPLTTVEAGEVARCFIADVAAVIDGVSGSGGVAVYTPLGAEAAFDGVLPRGFGMLAQRGIDLGERMLNAVDDLFSAGFGGVCLVNSDSPALPAALLRQAVAELQRPGDSIARPRDRCFGLPDIAVAR